MKEDLTAVTESVGEIGDLIWALVFRGRLRLRK